MCKSCLIVGILFFALVVGGFLYLWNEAHAAQTGDVVINEVAWMGTFESTSNEWIELRNTTGEAIDITDWTLVAQDGIPEITLEGQIPASEYFLLERTDDNSAPAPANQIYTGALKNEGEYLQLLDDNGSLIDEINAAGGWPAGDNDKKETMALVDGSWVNGRNGGTPRAQNSQATPEPEPESTSPTSPETTEGQGNESAQNPDGIEESSIQPPEAGPPQSESLDEEKEGEPSISIDYPTEVQYSANVPFVVDFSAENLKDKSYDVKISILNPNGSGISNIYNAKTKQWQSARFYVQNAFSGTSFNGNFLKNIRDDYLDYNGNATIIAQIRESGKKSFLLKTEGEVFVQRAQESATVPASQYNAPRTTASNKKQRAENSEQETITAEEFAAQIGQTQKSGFPFIPLILGIIIAIASGAGFILIKRKSSDT